VAAEYGSLRAFSVTGHSRFLLHLWMQTTTTEQPINLMNIIPPIAHLVPHRSQNPVIPALPQDSQTQHPEHAMQTPPQTANRLPLNFSLSPLPSEIAGPLSPNWNEFLQSGRLHEWEHDALRSYAAVASMRQGLGTFFVLLALNAVFRLVLMGAATPQIQAVMLADLGGFAVVGTLAVITFFVPRWWLLLATAIAIFPCALGLLTGILAVSFLCLIPGLKRANAACYLSAEDYEQLKEQFALQATVEYPAWVEIGKLANLPVRARFFDNAALLVAGNKYLNTIPVADAGQCRVEANRKGQMLLKQWPVDGKLRRTNIALTEGGHSQWQSWSCRAAVPPALPSRLADSAETSTSAWLSANVAAPQAN
jgi:hypothetical protein